MATQSRQNPNGSSEQGAHVQKDVEHQLVALSLEKKKPEKGLGDRGGIGAGNSPNLAEGPETRHEGCSSPIVLSCRYARLH
jgi:hypothetical protein